MSIIKMPSLAPVPLKLVVVGDDAAGKATLLITYVSGSYPKDYTPTVFDNYSVIVQVDDKQYELGLWETACQEDYDRLRPLSYSQVDVFLVVFSVSNPASFQHVTSKWIPEVMHHCPNVPIVIAGTKIDERDNPEILARLTEKAQSAISMEQGRELAKLVNAAAYVECSAKAQIGLQYTIETAIRAATAEHKRVPNMSSFYVDTLRKACASGNLKEMCNLVDRLSISTLNEPNADGITAVDVALANNQMELVKILVLAGVNITPNLAKGPLGNLQVVKKCVDLSNQSLRYIPANFLTRCKHSEELDLSHNHLSHEFGDSQILKIQKLNLSHNTLLIFPFKPQAFPALRSINLAYNKLATLPDDLMTCLPNLEVLDVSYNLLESLQPDLGNIKDLDATGNPLSSILPAYRHEKDKIVFFLKVAKSQAMQPWNQVKLMLVGQEQVGKTSLLRALQEEKSSSPDAVRNVSTNGVTITTLNLSRSISSSLLPSLSSSKKPKGSQKERVRCNVWDFGGQSVFHSTHRFFITPFAVYVVLYDMSKPETCERLKYWLEQIGAYNDFEGTKPIVIVGTHADLLGKSEKERIMKNMDMLYPTMTPQKRNRTQVHGHYAVSLTDKQGLAELRDKLMDLVLSHPRVGVGQVQVPRSFVLMQRELEDVKLKTPYLRWSEYSALANSLDIGESSIPEITNILHDTGFVVWHNVPKLREIVVIDPQWLADAMAGVVTFICQITVSKQGGMIDWHKMRDSLRLKFPNPEVHSTVIYMLEFFEIIYKMRGIAISARSDVNSEQMYFVPSLLSSYVPSGEHPAIKFWHAMKPKHTYKRRFTWNFFPAGFFPRILLRLAHLRMRCVASWLDAAIIAGRHGDECAFLHLAHSRDDTFCLDVNVKAEESEPRNEEPLVAELAYVISRLHSDMYHLATGSIDLVHLVLISNEKGGPAAISRVGARFLSRSLETKNIYLVHVLDEKNDPAQQSPRRIDHARSASLGNTKDGSSFLPFEECIRSQMEGKTHILVEGRPTRISDIVPDMSGCNLIQDNDLAIEKKIGEGGFGVVYKGRLLRKGSLVDVAVKEMQKLYNKGAIYDFQHESVIMSKLKHVNLVQLYGITKTPLRMVLEYVPKSDLHELLMKKQILSVKWKLKMAIDCACGMRYLHSQTPPICHSDLRAPNIFVASLEEEESAVVGKVADFGLSQQVFPYSQQTLYNIVETAPETWEGGMYDEKSDVFSFAVILWRLFGSRVQYEPQHANGVAENGKKTDKAARNSLNDEDDEEFDYLKVDGKHVPPPKQRDLIRKGARPLIHTQCPSPLISLIKECWKTISETRPSFRTICEFLVRYYASLYGEDKYITQKQKEIGGIDLIDPVNTKETSPQSYFSANKWLPIEVTGTVTTILELPTEMWLGTSVGGLAMIDKQSTKIQKLIPSLSRQDLPSHLLSRKMPLILVDPNCVWAAVGNEIHILSTKTKSEIVATIVTNSPITAMLLIPDSMLVWVSDTDGYVTIWDGLSFQKCYRFKIHPQNCAHSMALLHSFVFVGVGKDLIAVHSRTLHVTQAEPTHGDRIQDILALPHTNQIWTCTRDGLVRLWRVTSVPLPASPNPSAPPTIAPPTPKPALPAAPSLPLLPRTPSKPTVTPARTSKSSLTISGSLLTTSGIALSIPALPSLSTSNHIKITMEKEWNMEVPVKCVGLLSDKGHVCAGTFHGTILLWNVQTLNQQEIQMPPNAQGHSVQSVLDTNSGLWCGLEGATHLLPSLRFQPAKKPTSKSSFFRTQSGGARLEGSATHTSDWKTQQESDE